MFSVKEKQYIASEIRAIFEIMFGFIGLIIIPICWFKIVLRQPDGLYPTPLQFSSWDVIIFFVIIPMIASGIILFVGINDIKNIERG